MSSVFFEGNTYTFGATVSPNPGTGTTSYAFNGLSSGATFGFILRAFNGFGFSNFIGPAITRTLEQILETREDINAFAWTWPVDNNWGFNYTTGNDVNLFYSSEELSATYWNFPGYTRANSGITLPNGYTSGKIITVPVWSQMIGQRFSGFPIGTTLICSWYQHNTLGSAATDLFIDFKQYAGVSDIEGFYLRQLLPQLGTGSIGTSVTLLGPTGGDCGWVRYAIEVGIIPAINVFNNLPMSTRDIDFRFFTTNKPYSRQFYFGAPQLELIQ